MFELSCRAWGEAEYEAKTGREYDVKRNEKMLNFSWFWRGDAMWDELLPAVSGIVMGSILVYLRPGLRLRIGAALAIVLATIATVASGEFRVSWGYLLVDLLLVAGSALVSMTLAHHLGWTASQSQKFLVLVHRWQRKATNLLVN